jgi:ATP-dependent RNA helicase RhlE
LNNFDSLDLIEPIQRALAEEKYTTPTPIQAAAIPPLLEGRDVLGCAQTGTGKTAAFLLPTLQKLSAKPNQGKPVIRALVLTPTRELAAQIGDSFEAYSRYLPLRHRVIFGGVNQRPQVADLRRGIDVLVATPGRLLDLHQQGYISFDHVEFFVLDEADRMLDMGFIHDIRRVLKLLPSKRQNLLFSATMPNSIVKLASGFLTDPIKVEVDQQSSTVDKIVQRVMFVERSNKKRLLLNLLKTEEIESAIVFTRTKHGANRVVKELGKGGVEAAAIHGNKSQGARTRALAGFKDGSIRVLVATDIASRGIDVDGVSHVFNYDLPNISESYVHRIGRTGRAGRTGIAVAFCDESETAYLRDIERLTRAPLEVIDDHDWHFADAMPQANGRRDTGGPPKKSGGGWRGNNRRPRNRSGGGGGGGRGRGRGGGGGGRSGGGGGRSGGGGGGSR